MGLYVYVITAIFMPSLPMKLPWASIGPILHCLLMPLVFYFKHNEIKARSGSPVEPYTR